MSTEVASSSRDGEESRDGDEQYGDREHSAPVEGDEARSPQARARGETESQRLDRNFNELLQELRVTQTGTQILFAFLLTMAFSNRFTETNEFQRFLYVVALVSSAGATALIIGPVSFHRLIFRQNQKRALVEAGNRFTIGGLVLLAVAMVSAVLLVLDFTIGGGVALGLSITVAVWFLLFWYVLPLVQRVRADRTR